MADKVTYTEELNVQLLSADGSRSRIIKIDNPVNMSEATGRASVEAAFAPCFGWATSDTTTAPSVFFFNDDNDDTFPMTQIGTIERITTEKTVRHFI